MSKTPTSPPTSPRRGKLLPCHVYMLDDSTIVFHMPQKSPGHLLIHEVAKKINLFELDYFDLEYKDDEGNMCWLDHDKPLLKQLPVNHLNFKFLVKFYTPDPGLLEDEFTRYLFALQIKRDLALGELACQEHTAVLLASYIVQADLGDYTEDQFPDHNYLSQCKLLPKQTEDIQVKVMEHHKEHIGQSPAEADFNLLDTARKVEMYGIRLHSAKDHEGVPLHLAVAHMGVLVFQNYTKINTFSWAKIRKLSFKRKKFLIKLHPEGYAGYYKDTVEFYLDSRDQCKNFWKKCIEHHAFFRCHHVKRQPRNKTRVMSRGSSFRYSGRTQKQLVEFVREHYTKRAPFERKDKVISTKAKPKNNKGLRRNPSPKHKQSNKNRSTSMRTVSSTTENRSAGATPKTATLNSRDVQFGMLNTSASSGSHTLEIDHSRDNIMDHSGHKFDLNLDQHKDSVHMHTETSSFRSSRDNDRNRTTNAHYEKENYNHQEDRREADDMVNMDHPLTGASENHSNNFNYNYYQLSYDGMMGAQDVSANQNAHDFVLDEDDNVSHDSYRLTSSSRDDSLERELDRYEIPNTVLHIDEEKLLRELEAEKLVVLRGAQKAVQDGGREDNKDIFLQVASELEDSIKEESQKSAENKPYVVSYQQTVIQDNLIKSSVENLELEVVGVLDSYCRSDSQEHDGVADKFEATDASDDIKMVSDKTNIVKDMEFQEMEIPVLDTGVCFVYSKTQVDGLNDQNINGDMKLTNGENNLTPQETETESFEDSKNLIDDIPYVLHKRHVSSERKTPTTLPKPRSRSKTPSPSRQMSVPLTRKQHRAQLEKIKTSLTSPLSPPKSPPIGKPRSASPQTRRTFDFVTYSKLPPCDSYSSKDDSLSPSKENEFMLLSGKTSTKEKYHTDDKSKDEQIQNPNTTIGNQKITVKKSGIEIVRAAANTPKETQNSILQEQERVLKEKSDNSPEKQCHRVLQIQKLDTFSLSSESDAECNEDQAAVLLDVDEDVNVILSECGEEDPEDSSASSNGVIDGQDQMKTPKKTSNNVVAGKTNLLEGSNYIVKITDHQFNVSGLIGDELESPEVKPDNGFQLTGEEIEKNDVQAIKENTELPKTVSKSTAQKNSTVSDGKYVTQSRAESSKQGMLTKTLSETSEDFPLPPPPPPPQVCVEEELSSPDILPPEVPVINLQSPGGGEMMEFLGTEDSNVQGIPAIVIRSATPLPPGGSSSGEESSVVEVDVPIVIPKTKKTGGARVKTRSGSLTSNSSVEDLPPPATIPTHHSRVAENMVISSDEDVEHEDNRDAYAFAAALETEARANPFSRPISSEDILPAPPVHDISSESDSDVAKPDLSDYQDAANLLEAEAMANPFMKIISGDQYFPSAPDHDVSSDFESDEEGLCGDASELFDAQQYLQSQVLANPFSVPRTGNELLPPPEHDISSESESDVLNPDSSELFNARSVLHSQAMANPFAVPLSGPSVYLPPPPPLDSDSSTDSEANDADEEDLPDAVDILEAEVMANPYMNLNNRNSFSDHDFPPPPSPPPRVESISNGAFNQAAESYQNMEEALPPPPPSPPIDVAGGNNFQDLIGKASMQSSSSSSSFEQMGQQIVEAEPLDALEKLDNPSLMQYSSESSSENEGSRVPGRTEPPVSYQQGPSVAQSFVMGNPMAEETDLFVNPYAQEFSSGNSNRNERVPPPTKPKPKSGGMKKADR